MHRMQQRGKKAAGVSLLTLLDRPPWYASVAQKLVTNPEPIDSPHSSWKGNQLLKHLDEELVR